MDSLLYFDDEIAVYEFSGSGATDEQAVKLLLSADSENPDFEKHVKPLLQYAFFATPLFCRLKGELNRYLSEHLSIDDLADLGFKVEINDSGFVYPLVKSVNGKRTAALVSVPDAIKRVREYAERLQYLAGLFLFSSGDKSFASVLSDIEIGNSLYMPEPKNNIPTVQTIETTVDLPPSYINDIMVGEIKPNHVYFDIDMGEDEPIPGRPDGWRSLPVCINFLNTFLEPPYDAFDLKRKAASSLLVELLGFSTRNRFECDEASFGIKLSERMSYESILGDWMVADRVKKCPWCGRPFVKMKESSTSYCSASCRTLYNRSARKLFESGETVDSVHDKYPMISRETIKAWQPTEGADNG